ncbi:MAG: hypothetical protein OHK93_000058 [Ramalina farinacea]|uniref:SEC7 domain-containing protein n=1 Tax=Ramalina farinacea TaxID=258253 RepID=A0AA43QGF7_9LECA|nr:hypothetical protein [Ramalina farinacea]
MQDHARDSGDSATRDERISHDLNLTENPRHSVVDNMLLSLNPDQSTLFSSHSRPTFSSGSDASGLPRTSHSRHVHSSSTNSDFTFPSESSPDQRSHQVGKGRRSNSSSNFPTTLQRIDSLHTSERAIEGNRYKAAPYNQAGPSNSRKGHAKKTSKGSSSSSVDYGQTRIQSMLPPAPLARRSASFDHGYSRRALHSASNSGNHPPLPKGFSQPLFYNDFEAAPMPTVPAGPRRGDMSPAFPPSPKLPPSPQIVQRRNSNKSSKSLHINKSRGGAVQWDAPKPSANNSSFLGSRRGSKQIPSGFMRSRNVSPARNGSESFSGKSGLSSQDVREAPKERHGFFRRVFSRGPSAVEAQPSQPQQPARDGSNTNRLYKAPAMEDLSLTQKENVPPPLAKKSSSFFRRRKKSITELTPMMPPNLRTDLGSAAGDGLSRSPTSSLRKVMNPYLANASNASHRKQSVAVHNEATSQPRPSTDRSSHLDSMASGRLDWELPPPPVDTPGKKTLLRPRPMDESFLYDDSSASRTPDSVEHARISREALARAPTSNPVISTVDGPPKSQPEAPSNRDINLSSVSGTAQKPTKATEKNNVPEQAKSVPSSTPQADSKSSRPWFKSSKSNDSVPKAAKEAPKVIEIAETSPADEIFHSATSTLHPLKDDEFKFPSSGLDGVEETQPNDTDVGKPTDEDRRQAQLLFNGDESITLKSAAAAWLGEPGPDRARVRRAYMELYQWQNLNILAALRSLCGRLYLKAESQQVDRILDAFTARWWRCNPLNGFKATDVVHTICYSILLLNTDLHQAEIETKMTRTQFLKNIMPTIRRVVTDAAPEAFINPRASTMPKYLDQRPDLPSKTTTFSESPDPRRSFEGERPSYRLSQRPSDQTVYTSHPTITPLDYNVGGDCGPLVKAGFHGKLNTWENQIELILKEFYNAVRAQPLPLFGAERKQSVADLPSSTTSLSVTTNNFLRRTPSMLSKAGSDHQSYTRGRPSENRLTTGRWQSKTRSRPRLYPSSTVASSRRSSFDEQSSVTSPSVTSAWSKFSSLGKTQTSMSTDSFASSFPRPEFQQSIGFANALSQAIIREENAGGDDESLRAAPLLEDESLELAGAPWAKEGILKHKHHLESVDKKAKDRNWVESFAVIEKGQMRLFSFSMNARSLRLKAKSQKAAGATVGGGNWADNAELLGSFVLRQTIASVLPPPGYSKTRPHVWALSLPTGAVHLFQVGTPEIVQEFVKTANYWSARLSKEPLVGALSNIEYGWSDSVINAALIHPEGNGIPSASIASARPSLQSSIRSTRSSLDQGSYRPKLPGDKVMINDWTPPPQSLASSALLEVDQLKALCNYVKNIEDELQKHNELRGAVLLTFSPRNPNAHKAMTNWERKSSYLLREIVKFRTYIDALQNAQTQKEKVYAERDGKATTSIAST